MKRSIFQIVGLLLLLPLFSGCNDSDDVAAIFTGKTWKLNYITVDGGHEMFGFWENEEQEKASIKELNKNGTYNIVFDGTVDGDVINGNIKGTVIATSTFEGKWNANAKNNSFKATVTTAGSYGDDKLAKNFIEGLNAATSYEGDSNNLYLLYKPASGKQTFRMVFRVVSSKIVNNMDTEKKQLELDKRYIRMASIWAENSYCQRRKVGALIVKDKMIISDGYNGTPSGFENVCEDENNLTKPYVLHAEANAITKIARSNNSSDGATMYVTASPCIECAKLIIQAGIKRVVYSEHYRLEDGIELLKRAGIEVIYTELDDNSSPNK